MSSPLRILVNTIKWPICKNADSHMFNSKYQHIQALHAENYKNSFFPRTVRLWNALPTSCRSATSIAIFNSQCQSWLTPKTCQRRLQTTVADKKYMEILSRVVQFIRVLLILFIFMALEVLHDNIVQYGYSLSDSTNEEWRMKNYGVWSFRSIKFSCEYISVNCCGLGLVSALVMSIRFTTVGLLHLLLKNIAQSQLF